MIGIFIKIIAVILVLKALHFLLIDNDSSTTTNGPDDDILSNELLWLSNEQLIRLNRIRDGKLSIEDIEIVIAKYDEDITWANMYSNIISIYDKGSKPIFSTSSLYNNYIKLPNIGREAHSYLYHIVNNYHNLASITVFTQG